MPENIRHTAVRFKTLCDDILVFSKKHHRDFRSVEIRVKKIVAEFGEKPVDKIKPAEIDAWLSRVTKTPATFESLSCAVFANLPRGNSQWQSCHQSGATREATSREQRQD